MRAQYLRIRLARRVLGSEVVYQAGLAANEVAPAGDQMPGYVVAVGARKRD